MVEPRHTHHRLRKPKSREFNRKASLSSREHNPKVSHPTKMTKHLSGRQLKSRKLENQMPELAISQRRISAVKKLRVPSNQQRSAGERNTEMGGVCPSSPPPFPPKQQAGPRFHISLAQQKGLNEESADNSKEEPMISRIDLEKYINTTNEN